MTKKMLIDAAHPEEVRVAVLDNGKVEDFDFESAARKPLRGNIYLARVTRVEPSLQAAFVDYGGNRHGFLAFSEIHPDYYQIPVSDRQALQAASHAIGRDDSAELLSNLYRALLYSVLARAGILGESLTRNEVETLLDTNKVDGGTSSEVSALFGNLESACFGKTVLSRDQQKTLLSKTRNMVKRLVG